MNCHKICKLSAVVPLVIFLLDAGRQASAQTVNEYQRQAGQLVQSYKFEEAIELLRAGLRQYPSETELLEELGKVLVQAGQADEGERLLQKVLAKRSHNPELLSSLAEAYLRQGKQASAISLLVDSLWHKPNDVHISHQLAHALFLRGEYARALEQARHSVELDPLDPRYRRMYALLLDIQGHKNESYQQLKITHRLAPQDASVLFQLSERERLAGQLRQALQSLGMASRLDPENPLYHSALSQVHEKLGEKAISIEEADRARNLAQAFEVYADSLALAMKGQKAEAARLLEPLVERNPEFITGALLLADICNKLGKERRAIELYASVLERDPSQMRAREETAWILVQKGEYDSALEALGKQRQESPNRTLVEAYRRQQAEDPAGALEELRQAEAESPLNVGLLQWIGFCLRAQGRKQEALNSLTKAEKLLPGNPAIQEQIRQIQFEIKQEKAIQFFNQKRWREALKAFIESLDAPETGPNPAAITFNIAYCRQQLEDLEGAVRDYQAGLLKNPEANWARMNLAMILFRLSRYREAATAWRQIPMESRTREIFLHLGLCYSYLGEFEKAEEAFQAGVNRGEPSPELLYNLGVTRLRSGRAFEAAWDLIRRSAAANYEPARLLLKRAGFTAGTGKVSGNEPISGKTARKGIG